MPSYRVALQVIDVRPGHRPSAVIEAAAGAVRQVAHLDKPDLVMEARQPWVVVRFSIDPTGRSEEDVRAWRVAARVEQEVDRVATFDRVRLSRRVRGEWLIVPR